MKGTEFMRLGLGYVLRANEIGTEVAVGRLSRSRGETHGELRVSSSLPGVKSYEGRLFQGRVNLSSDRSRKEVARTLDGRTNGAGIDWAGLLEEFCVRTLAAEREGEPPTLVGTLPRPVGVNWRLDPIIPAGKPVILYGEGGTGKSTLAAAFAVSVETGVTVIEHIVPRQARVLYLDWEADRDEINDRVRGVAMGANLPSPAQILYRACAGPLADQAEELASIVAREDIGLVIVDSVGLAAGTSSDGADAAESALRLFTAFRVMSQARSGCSVLAVDHVSKSESEAVGRAARPYGSIYKTNLARAMFEVRRSGTTIGIYHTKSNVSALRQPIPLSVEYDEDGAIRYRRLEVIPTELTKPLRLAERIAAVLAGGHLEAEEIAELVGATEATVRTTMNRDKGRFNRLGSGKWEVIARAS